MSIGTALPHNPPPGQVLRTMFSDNVSQCLRTGSIQLPPQSTFVCPGADENAFASWIDILIHKCFGLSEPATLSNWSSRTWDDVKDKLDAVITKHNLTNDPLVNDLRHLFKKMEQYTKRGTTKMLEARENVRSFLMQLFSHSAIRVIDKESTN